MYLPCYGLYLFLDLTKKTLFLWHEFLAPHPYPLIIGKWDLFPEPPALIGFLRHVLLPFFFECHLDRQKWDKDQSTAIPYHSIKEFEVLKSYLE